MSEKYNYPNDRGYFGEFGGRFVSETLIEPLYELTKAYSLYSKDESFKDFVLDQLVGIDDVE